MIRFAQVSFVAAAVLMALAAPVFAQPEATEATAQEEGATEATAAVPGSRPLIEFSGALGVGLTVIGAGYGISRLAASALESMARQPEVAGSIQTAMIIAAALIEGFTFYALYICSTQNPWLAS